jgi:hypothetical protein
MLGKRLNPLDMDKEVNMMKTVEAHLMQPVHTCNE